MKEYFSKSIYYITTWGCDYSEKSLESSQQKSDRKSMLHYAIS